MVSCAPQPRRGGTVRWAGMDIPPPGLAKGLGTATHRLCPLHRRAGLLQGGIFEDFEDPGALAADWAEEADGFEMASSWWWVGRTGWDVTTSPRVTPVDGRSPCEGRGYPWTPRAASAVERGFAACSQPAAHTYKFTWAITTVPRGEAGAARAPRRCRGIAVPAAQPTPGRPRPGPSVPHAAAGDRGDVVAAWEKRRHMLVET